MELIKFLHDARAPSVHASVAGLNPRGVIIFRPTDFAGFYQPKVSQYKAHSLLTGKLKCDHMGVVGTSGIKLNIMTLFEQLNLKQFTYYY